MTVSDYELNFEYFTTAEINNSSLLDYKKLMNEFLQVDKSVILEFSFLKSNELPAEIQNHKLKEFGFLFSDF